METKELFKQNFTNIFKYQPDKGYFSPGRINIIGEHIDYNGGRVLPMAITLGIFGFVKFNDSTKIRVCSEGFNNNVILEFAIDDESETDSFLKYVKGVIYILKEDGFKITKGFDLYLKATLPPSSGLSSSAALELLIAHILKDEFDFPLTDFELVKLAQRAEREYVKVNCGIMDQFAIGMSIENMAILLDTNTCEYSYIPFDLGDNSIVIMNTNKPRNLVDSKYNERREECERTLKKLGGRKSLCEYTLDELESSKDKLQENEYKRAKHVITENIRVLEAINAMKEKNLKRLGELLNLSHISLKDDYEVTGFELDTIFMAINEQKGVYGGRMTGAGFGGCAICLVQNEYVEKIINKVKKIYEEKTKLKLDCYVARSNNRTGRIL